MSDDLGCAVWVHSLNHASYLHEELMQPCIQFLVSTNLCVILTLLTDALWHNFCATVSTTKSAAWWLCTSFYLLSNGAIWAGDMQKNHCKKLLEDMHCMVKLDGRNGRHSVKIIRDEEAMSLATDPLRMNYVFQLDSMAILLARAINLGIIRTLHPRLCDALQPLRALCRFCWHLLGLLKSTLLCAPLMCAYWTSWTKGCSQVSLPQTAERPAYAIS